MKYMLLIYSDENIWTESSREHCYAESMELTRELDEAGHFLGAAPLHPVADATSVRLREGKRMVTDGPFAETREQLGGFFMIEASNLDEAIEIAARIPGARVGTVEIRPVVELPGLSSGGQERKVTDADREIVSARVFEAWRSQLFDAWTKPEHLKKWWGPKGFTNTFHEFDPRPGGHWRFIMHGPDGIDYDNVMLFEVVSAERIVMRHLSAPHFTIFATFDEVSYGTKLTFRMQFENVDTCQRLKGICVEANEQNFDRLAEELKFMKGLQIGVEVDA